MVTFWISRLRSISLAWMSQSAIYQSNFLLLYSHCLTFWVERAQQPQARPWGKWSSLKSRIASWKGEFTAPHATISLCPARCKHLLPQRKHFFHHCSMALALLPRGSVNYNISRATHPMSALQNLKDRLILSVLKRELWSLLQGNVSPWLLPVYFPQRQQKTTLSFAVSIAAFAAMAVRYVYLKFRSYCIYISIIILLLVLFINKEFVGLSGTGDVRFTVFAPSSYPRYWSFSKKREGEWISRINVYATHPTFSRTA